MIALNLLDLVAGLLCGY